MADDWGEWGDGVPLGPAPEDDGEWGDGAPLGPAGDTPGPGPTPTPQASDFIFEILIGNSVIWSKLNAFPTSNLEIDVSSITDIQTLTMRIRGLA